ncbi:MAG: membrane protein insertase YidC, partial [Alistipes sp.]|nr:membrane protein insertase YidC [Alistipes sp.]
MDKKSIAGIAVVSVLFVIFMVINGRQQREYQEKLRAYQEYVASQTPAEEPADEVAAAPAEDGAPAIDSLVNEASRRRIAALGETLAASAEREPETLTVAN